MTSHKTENSCGDYSSSCGISKMFEDGSAVGQTLSEFLSDYLTVYKDADKHSYVAEFAEPSIITLSYLPIPACAVQ